ncbi:serine hydrolase [Marinivivus vitaminiproducens]|uniref:serine hydrolase n=1 Tax=Marinivivus vitaminiproducens TaxID=3035935 RepID=UPI0027A58DCF|nr:hypothetical protein P4R82_19505 [Geminicoccaceae bacterium SCSIO 64248]
MSFYRHDSRLQAHLAGSIRVAAAACELDPAKDGAVAACLVRAQEGELLGAGVQAHRHFYPASLVKLFHAAAYVLGAESGSFRPVEEDERALAAMLRQSSDDADQYLVARMTGTTGGVWLDGDELNHWAERRQALTIAFQSMGVAEFEGITVANPTFADGPYGAEVRFRQALGGNRLSPLAVTRMMVALTGLLPPALPRAGHLLALLDRAATRRSGATERSAQVAGFLAAELPAEAALWSKAGWTGSVRHDAIVLRLPGAEPVWLTAMTSGERFATSEAFLPRLGALVLGEQDMSEAATPTA